MKGWWADSIPSENIECKIQCKSADLEHFEYSAYIHVNTVRDVFTKQLCRFFIYIYAGKNPLKTLHKIHAKSILTQECVCLCGAMCSTSACTSLTLRRVFAPRLCHSGHTHRFRCCLSAAAAALEYPKKHSRNDNTEELYFLLYFINVAAGWMQLHKKCLYPIYQII